MKLENFNVFFRKAKRLDESGKKKCMEVGALIAAHLLLDT